MNERELVAKLNWFYSLELNQVDLYTAQARAVEDIYMARTFARIAAIEQQHVDNLIDEDIHTAWFANKLRELEQLAVKA